MTWAKVDDNFFHHPKAIAAGPEACTLYVGGLCYCKRFLTDGQIPAEVVRLLVPNLKRPQARALQLVAVGLWKPTPSGFEVHDWLQWNDNADDIRAQREANRLASRERQRRFREAHANKDIRPDGNATGNAVTEPVTEPADVTLSRPRNAPPIPIPIPRPIPTPTPSTSTATTPVRNKTEKAGSGNPRGFQDGGPDSRPPAPRGDSDAVFLVLLEEFHTAHLDWTEEQVREAAIKERQRRRLTATGSA